jgi:dUTPase
MDGGWDLYLPVDLELKAGERVFFNSGCHILLPVGWTGLIRPRSSSYKKGIVANGTIDAGYTGELTVGLENHSNETLRFNRGDRVVQLIPVFSGAGLMRVCDALGGGEDVDARMLSNNILISLLACELIREVDVMPETDRGENGHGSSGL